MTAAASAANAGPPQSELPQRRRQPGLIAAIALSFLTHAVLFAVMFVGVRFQSAAPEAIMVELWEAPPPPPAPVVEEPKPVAPPAPEPLAAKPAPEPQVTKPAPAPEPKVEKPDIALPEKPKPKPKPKPEPPKRDLAFERQLREQVANEQSRVEEQRRVLDERERIARQQASLRARALAAWTDKIRGKIRGNIVMPREIVGNPEAIFDVTLLPTGEVLSARKRQSSGQPAYDDAVERAIMKSSPLPKPDDPSLFQRQLELKFRPQDR